MEEDSSVSPSVSSQALDRSSFDESFEVLAVRVPARQTGQFLKQLKNQLLNIARRKNVEAITGDTANHILLARSLEGDIARLPSAEKAWLDSQLGPEVRIESVTVQLGYEHFTVDEILKKMLPAGVDIPGSFEQAGHVVHLNLRDSQLPFRFLIAQVMLDKNKSVRTVINKTGKIETEFRTFPMEHLAGDPETVVQLKEQNCIFEFEYKDVYWNSRLQMEHGRLIDALFLHPVASSSEMSTPKFIIADATCGVGPFSVPIIKHGTKIVSHANDLNPQSVRWLRRNAEINKLETVELELLEPFGDRFAPTIDGTRLLIHQPGCARVFIRSLFEHRHPVTHSIFNLPATGVELLDCYRGLDFEGAGLPQPLVSCYTFSDAVVDSDGPDGCVADLLARLATVLAVPLSSLRYVREPGSAEVQRKLPLASPQVSEMVLAAENSREGAAVAIRLVRNVAPTRHMFCVCFRAPRVGSGQPIEKRVRVV